MVPVTIDELRTVYALQDQSDELLQWILDRSVYSEYEDGEVIVRYGDAIDDLWIILEGSANFYRVINDREVHFYTFENNKETGGITGLLPYSRMKTSVGISYAVGKVRRLGLHKSYFEELERLSPMLVERMVSYMTDRARAFATAQLQYEKVNALGKLAAGIAHELNNPASAINRLSEELDQNQCMNIELSKKLLIHCVDPKHIDSINEIVCQKKAQKPVTRMTVKVRMEMEDRFSDWLSEKGVTDNTDLCEIFTNTGVTVEELETIHSLVQPQSFGDVMHWFGNQLSIQRIIKDLELASGRISKLVGAIKSHVHMDRTNDMQQTQIVNDIDNTLMLLGHKLREKNIEVIKKYCDPVPEIDASIGELNQVWMNVLDNAIFAMGKNGKLTIEIFTKNSDLKVNIIDDGTGIPADVLPRIFDPFYTTKNVGEGTGIGLDIVNRVIKKHKGDIKVSSSPGNTTFSICLPVRSEKKEG